MRNTLAAIIVSTLFVSAGTVAALAGDTSDNKQTPITTTTEPMPAFRKGAMEVELRGGPMFSVLNHVPTRPVLDYAVENLRFGYMLNDVRGDGIFRGNEELLVEGIGGEVFKGPGKGFGGGELIFRHNFVQPGAWLVPYLDLGGGAVGNDIFHNQTQSLIGEDFQFILHGALGTRWMITDQWALSLEADYWHISDAGLSSRNDGLNSVGSTLGVNFLF